MKIQQGIYFTFSKNLLQFISVTKGNNEYEKYNIYARDYSKFSTESFR